MGASETSGMKIGELAARSGVSVRSLRYYEQQGLLTPERTRAGHRVYTAEQQVLVSEIRSLLEAGFCSSVIQELLPALQRPEKDRHLLLKALSAAEARLESEKRSVEAEIANLERLRNRLGLAPDMHVIPQDVSHDSSPASQTVTFDHRDRRLR